MRPIGQNFLPIIRALTAVGETFPSIAVLGIVALMIGYGLLPMLIALSIYVLLPIVKNTIADLAAVLASVKDTIKAMSRSSLGRSIHIELLIASLVIWPAFAYLLSLISVRKQSAQLLAPTLSALRLLEA